MLKPIKTKQECSKALERVYNLMQKEIAKLYNVGPSTIFAIKHGKSWVIK